jgi:hypothetical protein
MPTTLSTLRFLVLIKGAPPARPLERYVFLWDDAYRADLLRTLGRFASNPDLSFNWYDAAKVSQSVQEEFV